MSTLRIICLGGGLEGLIAMAEAHFRGACVDILEKSSRIGGSQRELEIDISQDDAEFLKKIGVNPATLTPFNAHETISEGIVAHLRAQPVKEVRVFYESEATSILTDVRRERALGVRFRRNVCNFDGSCESTEANIFGDALVYSLDEGGLQLLCCKEVSTAEDGGMVTVMDQPLAGFFLSKRQSTNINSLKALINFARRAGRLACETSPVNFNAKGMRQPLPFLDKNGVCHGVALSPTEWIPLMLENRIQLNRFNHLFRFALDDKNKQAGHFCGQYLSIRAMVEGKEVIRFYSPVSRNSDYGHIDLTIKIEENTNNKPMEKFLSEMKPGQTVEFKGPSGGFEYHRNMYREIGMIAGGTGITPMVQIIRSISHHPEDDTHAKLLYGNYNEEDILCRDELSYYTLTRSNIDVYISLNNPPGKWAMGVGFVNEDMIRKALPAPAHDIIILLCGPPPMIKAMLLILKAMGYTDQMIFSFI